MRRTLTTRAALAVAIGWSLAVTAALASTLASLGDHAFDGLNNVWQIPFALPWFILPLGSSNDALDAWMAAVMGWVNAVLLALWLTQAPRRAMACTDTTR